jgi:DNA polymerase elongation subunit (family B)
MNYRLYEFNFYNEKSSSSSAGEGSVREDDSKFTIQMFGINEFGKTASIFINNFKPFFYVSVDDSWNDAKRHGFMEHINKIVGDYYKKSIKSCEFISRKKLYGFDANKIHLFLCFTFHNLSAFNKVKRIWYNSNDNKLFEAGYVFKGSPTFLYESNIPPLLRFFHVYEISPSGWIQLQEEYTIEVNEMMRKTTCDYEYIVDCEHITPLPACELRVPYKICSFDIEASSSHGDFPVPIKSYKKLATNIIEYFEKMSGSQQLADALILKQIILFAFGFGESDLSLYVDFVYPKKRPTQEKLDQVIEKWLNANIAEVNLTVSKQITIEKLFQKMNNVKENEDDDEEEESGDFVGECEEVAAGGGGTYKKVGMKKMRLIDKEPVKKTIIDILNDTHLSRDKRSTELNISLDNLFPKLEGDKVTFIGSTFLNAGESVPFLNHCVVLGTCAGTIERPKDEMCCCVEQEEEKELTKEEQEEIDRNRMVIESYATEAEVLIAWQQLIQRENPDIVIGYNIFGFDYEFMFRRAEENHCVNEFLKLSKNKEEICGNQDMDTGNYNIEENSVFLASGQHDFKYIKMNGRVQIDLYTHFRKEENLSSYKLDSVAGHFIGDYVKKILADGSASTVYSNNLYGLTVGSFVHFEEIGHTIDYYDEGKKFQVASINKRDSTFTLTTSQVEPDFSKKVRWCLAKDDITPKDIFRLTNGDEYDRALIAKYCIQDCNLVHYLLNKVDVITGFIEMSHICSVPINFLVLRGQGIKLTSYVAKKCREKNTLLKVIEKKENDNEGYEGAIVLEPKCDMYLDVPVACVDYASLYPSSMLSENISHDSKVWTKEFDISNNLIRIVGEQHPETKEFIYDNLPDYTYVNIVYDTYSYVRSSPSAAAKKVRSGYKVCRFAQFPNDTRAIMPSILEELLSARKRTRKLIPGEKDPFKKNILDKRQLAYKLCANSLYGQCGAKTSTFYEKDIAASTTATGRVLLQYAKKIIETCYKGRICSTSLEKYPTVITDAEYIYGDTDSVFFTFNLRTNDGSNTKILGRDALILTIELAQQAGNLASKFLKQPHDLEYEKTFMPFFLLSKKRYVGMLYEKDPNYCKRKEMGIVLKRRDNAPIVKDIYGGIIDILMKHQNIEQATRFLKESLQDIVDKKCPAEKLIITKSLRSGYKNPNIAHKVLADRIAARDPGNKPSSGDRIAFIYIQNPNKKALQGERIETPTFIIQNRLKIDYAFYITNQIMKPVQQLFALGLEKIWQATGKIKTKMRMYTSEVAMLRKNEICDVKFRDKVDTLRNKEIKTLLFDEFLRETTNISNGNAKSMTSFYKVVPKK